MTRRTSLTPEAIKNLTVQPEPWLSCDDCFDQVDAVVEGLLTGRAPMSEEFRIHMLGCPACHEEARGLTGLIAPDYGIGPEDGLARLEAGIRPDRRH